MEPLSVPFLVGSWVNTALFVTEAGLVLYFLMHRKPSRSQKLGMYPALALDFVGSCVQNYSVYLYLYNIVLQSGGKSVGSGNLRFHLSWTAPVTILLTFLSAGITELFFVHRYWSLSKCPWMTAILILLLLTHIVIGISSQLYMLAQPLVTLAILKSNFGAIGTITSCVAGALLNLLSAACLAIVLLRHRSLLPSTKSTILRVSIISVLCGFTTASWTIVVIILFAIRNSASIFFMTCAGRVYTLTLLFNFLLLGKRKPQGQLSSITLGSIEFTTPVPAIEIVRSRSGLGHVELSRRNSSLHLSPAPQPSVPSTPTNPSKYVHESDEEDDEHDTAVSSSEPKM